MDREWAENYEPNVALSHKCHAKIDGGRTCLNHLAKLLDPLWATSRDAILDPLCILRPFSDINLMSSREALCRPCQISLHTYATKERRQLWNNLPEWFGLNTA